MTCNKCEALQRILVQQYKDDAAWRKQVLELKAHNNDLREDLGKILVGYANKYLVEQTATEALSKTPAQSIQEHDSEVK